MTSKSVTTAIDAYLQSTMQLVRSLTIKSSISAQRLNTIVISKHGNDSVDPDRPHTWKYYMNISGQYHFTDKIMRVISLDTHEEIDFTKETLRIHTATAKAYRYGTRFYFSLVNKYPDQEQLILAINNPADIQEAIDAEDGTILAYYRDLVESQEDTLIYDLEKYIKAYLSRYTVIGFNNIWRNYPVISLANLYASLVPQVLNLRLLACKTNKTHSFHIEQYLASHGYLDKYIKYMTLKQKLYLYHNIEYIEKFAGHTDTFNEIIQWILSDRRIPISSYTVRQLQDQDESGYPLLISYREPIGTMQNNAESEYVDMETYFHKESKTKPGNVKYFIDNKERILHDLKTTDSSVIQTKDLESAMIDYTDAVPDTLPEVLLRQWAYMSAKGLYNVIVNFNHPITGDRISILAKDALIYYSYVMMTIMGYRPIKVPSFLNVKFRLHPRPSAELLYKDLVPSMFSDLKDIADSLIQPQPIIEQCFSVSGFFDLSYQIYEEAQRHWFLKSSVQDPFKRGIVAKMISRLYGIEDIVLYDGDLSMQAWLKSLTLPEFEGTGEEGLQLCKIIFEQATGYTVDDTKSLRSIQKAMTEIFTQLSSYSVQIMREINDSAIIPLNWAAIRTGFRGQDTSDALIVKDPTRIQAVDQEFIDEADVTDNGQFIGADLISKPQEVDIKSVVDVNLCPNTQSSFVINTNVNIPTIRVYDDKDIHGASSDAFQPMTYYNALSQEQLKQIANSIFSRK